MRIQKAIPPPRSDAVDGDGGGAAEMRAEPGRRRPERIVNHDHLLQVADRVSGA
jgi:hypothetical protein